MRAAWASEMLLSCCNTTWCHTPRRPWFE